MKIKKLLAICTIFTLLLSLSIVPTQAVSSSKATDRGTMTANLFLSKTVYDKYSEFSVSSTKTATLAVKSKTVLYSTGAAVSSTPRYTKANATSHYDYTGIRGYQSTTLRIYSTHESIYTYGYAIELTTTC